MPATAAPKRVQQAFDAADSNGDGYIDAHELKAATWNQMRAETDVRATVDMKRLKEFDKDGNGRFDVHEFAQVVKVGEQVAQRRGHDSKLKGPAEVVALHTVGIRHTPQGTPRKATPPSSAVRQDKAAVAMQAAARGRAARIEAREKMRRQC